MFDLMKTVSRTLNQEIIQIIVKWKTEGMEGKLASNAIETAFQFSF